MSRKVINNVFLENNTGNVNFFLTLDVEEYQTLSNGLTLDASQTLDRFSYNYESLLPIFKEKAFNIYVELQDETVGEGILQANKSVLSGTCTPTGEEIFIVF